MKDNLLGSQTTNQWSKPTLYTLDIKNTETDNCTNSGKLQPGNDGLTSDGTSNGTVCGS
jgi:hypothetical protein